ncbi:MAG: sensor histidine kinase [Clostridiales bacterium]|nr:sensor histidine kinase [Clostridiales bacterium]
MPEDAVYVSCEKRSADRILENLISNALKYSDGDLKVSLDTDGKIIFRNSAPGLTPVTVSKLFDKYYTVNEGEGSTGLGFSIARELMEKNSGTIEAALQDSVLIITLSFTVTKV